MNLQQLNIMRKRGTVVPRLAACTVPRAGPELARPGPPGSTFDGYPVYLKNRWSVWYRIRYPTEGTQQVRPPPIRAGDLPPPFRERCIRSGCSPGDPPPQERIRWICHGPEPPPLTHLRSPPKFWWPRAGPCRPDSEVWKHIQRTGPPQIILPPGYETGSRSRSWNLLTGRETRQGRVT